MAAIAGVAAAATPAQAAGCDATFSAASHVLVVDSCDPDPDAPVISRISRTPEGAIRLDDQPIAGGPTVTNTDEIVYRGDADETDELTIDMSNGQFAPGSTPEILGMNEIEFTLDGGDGATNFLTLLGDAVEGDAILVGAAGIDLRGDDDSDIARASFDGMLAIDGGGGNDYLRAAGFPGHGASAGRVELRGGAGRDFLGGGQGADRLFGGAELDLVIDDGGSFLLTDTSLTGNGTDTLASIERATLTGGMGADVIDASAFSGAASLIGFGGADTLIGGPGDDSFRGHLDDDTIDGGPGTDTINDAFWQDVVLTDESMTGIGTDSLRSIETAYIFGSAQDQTFDASGFSGPTRLVSGGGADKLIGGPAGDRLEGGEGPDELTGGGGTDAFFGGAGDDELFSGDDVSEQVHCGDGSDTALADALDGLLGCEQIDRGAEPPQPGDPTQPAEPGQPSTPGQPGTPGADTIAPVLSELELARRAFGAARAGAGLATAARAGSRMRFTLSEPATVTFRIERAARGRRAGGRCRAPSVRNRTQPSCIRFVRLRGSLSHAGAQGANAVRLRGRLRRRALAPGRYRLVAGAIDAAGNRSAARRIRFRILAR